MSETWATSGVDLHLDVTGRRVRAGLEGALRDAVRTGRLRPRTQLPSSRALARDLGIARNTVAEAYGQLVAEGWLTARRGSGTQVADRAAGAGAPPSPPAAEVNRLRYDLRAGSPDLSAFPRQDWLAAARRALGGAPSEALGYGDPRGRPELRRTLADYLSRARGVRATPDRIV
ncbi:MAG TPA: GntR family transcriptional regulator [Streptosporangiaceae bacterium]|nr:GntR family transcriptional regulator [Streptosporangiaceae bacterium]